MPANLWKSLTVRFMALGHSLYEAQYLAAVIVFQVVLLCTVMGYRVVRTDMISRPDGQDILDRESKAVVVRICGIFPALTGTAADTSRALLFTQ